MALLEWRKEFEIGIPAVDYEHRSLIELINSLHSSLGARASKDEVADFLAQIYKEISLHFALEERIMRETGYDEYADHKAEHERLLDEIREIMDSHEDDAYYAYADALGARLDAWFGVHFRTKDARLHRLLG